MALDVEVPDPPSLYGSSDLGDYDAVDEPDERRGDQAAREALADMLANGAWADAFEEWRAGTSLSDAQYETAVDAGLFEALDFYWNPSAEDVGYRAPSVPADLPDSAPDLDRNTAQEIEAEFDTLGRIVSEVLENEYVDRDSTQYGYDWE